MVDQKYFTPPDDAEIRGLCDLHSGICPLCGNDFLVGKQCSYNNSLYLECTKCNVGFSTARYYDGNNDINYEKLMVWNDNHFNMPNRQYFLEEIYKLVYYNKPEKVIFT